MRGESEGRIGATDGRCLAGFCTARPSRRGGPPASGVPVESSRRAGRSSVGGDRALQVAFRSSLWGLHVCLGVALAVAIGGCADHAEDRIRTEVQALTLAEGEAVQSAADRVAAHGRRALPAIEAALHTADVAGRKNLVIAIRHIGDADGIPLLLHLAAFDAAEDVRREAAWTLRSWAAGGGDRAERARAALRRLDELRHGEEAG